MTGFACNVGTDVEPTCSMTSARAPSAATSSARWRSKRLGHSSEYGASTTVTTPPILTRTRVGAGRELASAVKRQAEGGAATLVDDGLPKLRRVTPIDYIAADSRYDTMKYRRCGRSGVELPAVSLGLWHNFGHDRPYETQRAIVRRAFDLGITHIDLANNYGPPYGVGGGQLRSDARRRPEAVPR